MARTFSPLRYPGGKSCLYPLITRVIRDNGFRLHAYAEPFAGGCGLGLGLLYGSHVSELHINDVDRAIWSFWYGILNETDKFAELISGVDVTVDEWRKQREIYSDPSNADPLALGFATFFLNRTNRSGVIKSGGVIGGLEQLGKYKIDCRFNKADLIRRIKRVSKYRSRT